MRNLIVVLFVAAIVLVVAIWFYSGKNPHAEQARSDLASAASETKQFVQDKLGTSNLTLENIKEEMSRTGQVIREKAQQAGASISDATADSRITAAIKAKLVKDPDLSALKISVSTTNGDVTLSGTASSPDNIRKAIQLAMDTDGVHKVVSTLQVKS
jgi:osmotically-inducible protein OsmY